MQASKNITVDYVHITGIESGWKLLVIKVQFETKQTVCFRRVRGLFMIRFILK